MPFSPGKPKAWLFRMIISQRDCPAVSINSAKPYSGKLNLRMPSELHFRVAAFVASTGTTINDFINRAITNELKKVAAL